jgi:hypothetical protein
MRIPSTDIDIDGTTAWLVIDGPRPGEYDDRHEFNRPCDTCDGVECSMGWDCDDTLCQCPCLHCHGTGRHTFTLDVQCDCPTESNPEPCMSITQLTVHVVAVLPIYAEDVPDEEVPDGQSHIVYNEGVGEFDLLNWSDDLGHWRCDGTISLPASAAPGKYAVRLEVHA